MRTGRAKLWAWTASIGLHIIAFAVFAASEFSPTSNSDINRAAPSVKIEKIKKIVQSEQKIVKPKIKYLQNENASAIIPSEKDLKIFSDTESDLRKNDFAASADIWTFDGQFHSTVDFFSTSTAAKRICFVVDCSGSMKGLFGTVKKELTQAIQNLQQDQYFGIIFFGDDKLLMFENTQMVRASGNAKAAAISFINSVEPKGKTNAIEAFEMLAAVRDSSGHRPSAVFFLTDGFELDKTNSDIFIKRMMNLLAINLPETIVNTIGFWPDENDCSLLRQIAEQTGGQFTCLGEKEN